MTNPKDPPLTRLDQIINQLGQLYAEADQIIDSHVGKVRERVAPTTPRGIFREPTGSLN
jgi:hypothetical protein